MYIVLATKGTGRTVNDVVFLRMLHVQHAKFFQIFCLASLEVIFLRIFAHLHSVHMLQAKACVHYVAGLARYRKVVRMLQAAVFVHYVAGQRF